MLVATLQLDSQCGGYKARDTLLLELDCMDAYTTRESTPAASSGVLPSPQQTHNRDIHPTAVSRVEADCRAARKADQYASEHGPKRCLYTDRPTYSVVSQAQRQAFCYQWPEARVFLQTVLPRLCFRTDCWQYEDLPSITAFGIDVLARSRTPWRGNATENIFRFDKLLAGSHLGRIIVCLPELVSQRLILTPRMYSLCIAMLDC